MYQTNILEYLEASAKSYPERVAFSDGEESLTFEQLHDRAMRIGSFLLSNEYTGECVAVFAKKSPDAIAAFLGVIYAGCYYVALDIDMGERRISEIIERVRPRAMIFDRESRADAAKIGAGVKKYHIDVAKAHEIDYDALLSVRERQVDVDPIYVVFTSGSSGEAKGVVASHASVIDYTETLCEALGFDGDTRFANQSPLYFDAPLKEIMPTLKKGACTYFVPRECFLFPIKLCEFLEKHSINTLCWVSSALAILSGSGALEKCKPQRLNKICFGSELMPVREYEKWRRAYPDATFVNLYGPTEATGMSCYWIAGRELDEGEGIPIGKPFRNTEILLISGRRRAADGECGEIYIRGRSVTLGYFGEREMTAGAFVQNPLSDSYNDIVYRTGDVGRYNKRGELVFVSRCDRQIKRRGKKVSLDEIEAAAERCEGVERAAAVFDEQRQKIVLYYTARETGEGLAARLSVRLLRHALPDEYIRLEVMPRTANGKKDRVALDRISRGERIYE
ncbi:MAG: amino acid adenylation domain-containing protein [Clostridia bacterium]|nr:amino acid adenylation domain-containing protein [Clostridia bacterium]